MKCLLACTALLALASCATSDANVTPRTYRCTTIAWLEPGKPLVEARIGGRTLTFLVDTGAEYDGWIKPEIAQELGLPVVGSMPSEGEDDPTGGLPFYGVDALQLGSLTFSGRRLGEMPQVGPKPQPFDGIIGNGLFKDMQAAFDYERSILQVTDLSLVKGTAVPFDKYGIPVLTLDVAGHPVDVHLDTGNLASPLFVRQADVGHIPLAGDSVKKGSAMTVSGRFDVMEAALAGPVRYGETVLPVTMLRWPGAYDAGQLGSKGLKGQTVRIDWRSRRVSIMPEKSAPTCPQF